MLVLTRNVGESIHIGPDIMITVSEVRRGGTQVKLAIEAPREVKIFRTELAARIAREGPALSKRA